MTKPRHTRHGQQVLQCCLLEGLLRCCAVPAAVGASSGSCSSTRRRRAARCKLHVPSSVDCMRSCIQSFTISCFASFICPNSSIDPCYCKAMQDTFCFSLWVAASAPDLCRLSQPRDAACSLSSVYMGSHRFPSTTWSTAVCRRLCYGKDFEMLSFLHSALRHVARHSRMLADRVLCSFFICSNARRSCS